MKQPFNARESPKTADFMESANHAILGIIISFRNERNLRVHFLIAIFILLLGLRLGVTRLELVLLFLAIILVFMAEMINTTIEILTNAFVDQKNPAAKLAKDVAAGSVLIAAIGSVFVGYLIFYDKIGSRTLFLFHQIKSMPLQVSAVSLVLVILVTIILKTFSRHGTPLQGGMPSGHAALAFATATIIFWFIKDLLAVSAAYLLATMVAQSRVEARMHNWWEVVSGAVIGFLLTLALLKGFLG